jgi:hypothetical protein
MQALQNIGSGDKYQSILSFYVLSYSRSSQVPLKDFLKVTWAYFLSPAKENYWVKRFWVQWYHWVECLSSSAYYHQWLLSKYCLNQFCLFLRSKGLLNYDSSNLRFWFWWLLNPSHVLPPNSCHTEWERERDREEENQVIQGD